MFKPLLESTLIVLLLSLTLNANECEQPEKGKITELERFFLKDAVNIPVGKTGKSLIRRTKDTKGIIKKIVYDFNSPDIIKLNFILKLTEDDKKKYFSNITACVYNEENNNQKAFYIREENYENFHSLAQKQKFKSYSVETRMKMYLDIVRGLKILHQNSMIHSDLRPVNLIWPLNSSEIRLDIGFSNPILTNVADYISINKSPEEILCIFQKNTNCSGDEKADMWAFALIVLDFENPNADIFNGVSQANCFEKKPDDINECNYPLKKNAYTILGGFNGDFEPFKNLILNCLNFDKYERPSSESFIYLFERFLKLKSINDKNKVIIQEIQNRINQIII
jgi:serine/threonine protein kinase